MIHQKSKDDKAQLYEVMARNFSKEKNIPKAVEFFKKVENLYKENFQNNLENLAYIERELGLLYLENHQLILAESYIQQSIKTFSSYAKLNIKEKNVIQNLDFLLFQNALGKLKHAQYKSEEKLTFLQEAMAIYAQIDSVIVENKHYGDEDDVLHFLSHAHEIYSNAIEATFDYYQITQNHKVLDDIYYYAERNKGNDFYQKMSLKAFQKENPESESLDSLITINASILNIKQKVHIEEDELKKASLQKELFFLYERFDFFKKQVQVEFPTILAYKYGFKEFSLNKVKKYLKDNNTTLLQFFWGEEHVFILGVTSGRRHDIGHLVKLSNSQLIGV